MKKKGIVIDKDILYSKCHSYLYPYLCVLHMQIHTVVSNTHEHSFQWVKSTTAVLFQYCKVNINNINIFMLSFQLVTQSKKMLKLSNIQSYA